jgi:hypothetical protein
MASQAKRTMLSGRISFPDPGYSWEGQAEESAFISAEAGKAPVWCAIVFLEAGGKGQRRRHLTREVGVTWRDVG